MNRQESGPEHTALCTSLSSLHCLGPGRRGADTYSFRQGGTLKQCSRGPPMREKRNSERLRVLLKVTNLRRSIWLSIKSRKYTLHLAISDKSKTLISTHRISVTRVLNFSPDFNQTPQILCVERKKLFGTKRQLPPTGFLPRPPPPSQPTAPAALPGNRGKKSPARDVLGWGWDTQRRCSSGEVQAALMHPGQCQGITSRAMGRGCSVWEGVPETCRSQSYGVRVWCRGESLRNLARRQIWETP